MHDLFIFRIQTAWIRRTILLGLAPFIFILFSLIRLTSALSWLFPDFRDVFLDVWRGVKNKEELLPCPFCGGRCNPEGWATMSGASGPSCSQCGSTAYNGDIWNRRAGD